MRRSPLPRSARALLLLTAGLFALSFPTVARGQGTTDSLEAAPAATVHKKSPALAGTLAIIPGAGHAYAGEGRRGLKVLGGLASVSLTLGFLNVGLRFNLR